MNEEKITNVDIEEVVEMTEVKANEGFIPKVKNGLKKYGKKAAIIASAAVIGIVGFALGRKSNGSDYDYDDDLIDVDAIETEDVYSEEASEE